MGSEMCIRDRASVIKNTLGETFLTVTPGIRPEGSDLGDQHRVMTPSEAISAGSDYLVMGRPITGADNPSAVITSILDRLKN